VNRPQLRSDVARFSRRLHAMGWVANHDGNVSVRLGRDRFLCTPTAVSKADVDEGMLIVVDGQGRVVEGTRKAFGELDLHLAIYRARPDANAVLHAHPAHATALGIAGVPLDVATMPEFVVSLGAGVPTVPLSMPKTPEALQGVESAARRNHAFLVAGNGAFSLGTDLEQAYLRLELVEHYARIMTVARQVGTPRPLAPAQVAKLLDARSKAGLEPPETGPVVLSAAVEPPASAPRASSNAIPAKPAGSGATPVEFEALAERVAARLGGRLPAEGELRSLLAAELAAATRS
jgi:L-fuculose-phosphate aldolase